MSIGLLTLTSSDIREHSRYSEAIIIFEVVSAIRCDALNELYSSHVLAVAPDSNTISFLVLALVPNEIKQAITNKIRKILP